MLHVYYTIRIVNRYSLLIETYSTERQKILGVWAMFKDEELPWRPHPRARSVHEQMVHQCVSEDHWMKNFLGIDLVSRPCLHSRRNGSSSRNTPPRPQPEWADLRRSPNRGSK